MSVPTDSDFPSLGDPSDAMPALPETTPPPAVAPAAPSGGISWAAKARTIQHLPVKMTAPTTVVAIDSVEDAQTAAFRNATHKTVIHNLPKAIKGVVALDTNAFIMAGLDDLLSVADVFVTVPQVLQEVKDKTSRELLERLPVKIEVLDPSPESIARVAKKAEKTGDFGVLSRTDVRLCALALECAEQLRLLRPEIEPRGPRIEPTADMSQVRIVTEEQSDDSSEDDEEESPASGTAGKAAAMPGWDDADDDDAEAGEWITPSNIRKIKDKDCGPMFSGGFACVTSDFPMQNVLLHLGVPIVGPAGRSIHELRTWLLRCHACFEIVHDTNRQFCPSCGSGNTLKRVSYIIDDCGEKRLFINFKKHISTRGTIYNLPKPRGGRKGTNRTVALREDQLAGCGKFAAALKTQQIARQDDLSEFASDGRESTRINPNMPRVFSSYKTYNVNERKKAQASRKK